MSIALKMAILFTHPLARAAPYVLDLKTLASCTCSLNVHATPQHNVKTGIWLAVVRCLQYNDIQIMDKLTAWVTPSSLFVVSHQGAPTKAGSQPCLCRHSP
jgi:hypothetical protein